MKMSGDKIEKLEKQVEQAKARLQAAKAREKVRERKLLTRKKILLGAYVLKALESGRMKSDVMQAELDRFLVSDRDRALFNLPPKNG